MVLQAYGQIEGVFAQDSGRISLGGVILPVIADAAATAGLQRYISLFGCPIRPTKLRFVVVSALSPSASIPM